MLGLHQWLKQAAISDPIEREQAYLLQIMLIGLGCIALFTVPLGFIIAPTPAEGLSNSLNSVLTVLAVGFAVWTLRRDHFHRAILIVSTLLLIEYAVTLSAEGLRSASWLLFGFAMPITLTGLLAGQRAIVLITALSIAIVSTIGVLELTTHGIIGRLPRQGDTLTLSIVAFDLWAIIVGLFFHRFSATLRQALSRALSREEELKQIRDQLEIRVHERTAELEQALQTVKDREAHLAQTNVALAEAKQTAEEANKLKSHFLANMSHELRTPLNAIINFTAFLERYGDFSERQKQLQERVLYNAEHLLGLINDVLDLSKIEAGRMELIYEDTDLLPLLQGVMTTAVGLTKEKNLDLIFDVPDDLPKARIDKTRIRQVLLNLISNAAKFTEQGSITLSVSLRDPHTLLIAVRDTGVGIAPEYQATVFEEFQQVPHESNVQQGTGLGLPISKRLVEMHGGQMTLQSTPGVGSTFAFSLPITPTTQPVAPQVIASPTDSPVSSTEQSTDILVVDDDPDAHEMLQVMLQGAGYTVASILDSRQALATIKQRMPRLVILDLEMPHINGWEVLALIKHDPVTAAIPVIVCSVLDPSTVGLVLGAHKHIVKPVREDTLLAVVRDCVRPAAHILIVDDNPDARTVMRNILRQNGYTLTEAENGREAMSALEASQPDLIILDLMMPEMDGFEVLARLRSDDQHNDVPVIIVSARELAADEYHWLLSRSQGVMAKSRFSEQEFVENIDQILNQGG